MPAPHELARKVFWLPVVLGAFFLGKQTAACLWSSSDGRDEHELDGTAPPGEGEPAVGSETLASFEDRFLGDRARDRQQVIAARTWEEFYEALRIVDLPPDETEALVLARIAESLGLTPERRQELARLFHDEQRGVTEEAIRRHGRERLYHVLDLPKAERRAFMEGLRLEREEVRRRFDGAYAALVGPDRLDEIDEHLRSDRIVLVRSKNDQSVSIGGVGYPVSH